MLGGTDIWESAAREPNFPRQGRLLLKRVPLAVSGASVDQTELSCDTEWSKGRCAPIRLPRYGKRTNATTALQPRDSQAVGVCPLSQIRPSRTMYEVRSPKEIMKQTSRKQKRAAGSTPYNKNARGSRVNTCAPVNSQASCTRWAFLRMSCYLPPNSSITCETNAPCATEKSERPCGRTRAKHGETRRPLNCHSPDRLRTLEPTRPIQSNR